MAAAELAVCRLMDPGLYFQVTEPVRHLYHSGRDQVKDLSADYAVWLDARDAERQTIAAEQRRQAAIRRLRKSMVRDQAEIMALLDRLQMSAAPVYLRTDPAVTEMVTVNGQEVLRGGGTDLVYFNQADEAWAEQSYGDDPIGGYGCGPTALAMVVSSMTGETVDPAEMAEWAAEEGYAAAGSGSYLSIVRGAARHFGLSCTSLESMEAAELDQALAAGGMVVALMGPGHFTARGHFIVLHGTTLTGDVLVADPNSRENSLAAWDPELILSELSPSRGDGAPLWLITPAADL